MEVLNEVKVQKSAMFTSFFYQFLTEGPREHIQVIAQCITKTRTVERLSPVTYWAGETT